MSNVNHEAVFPPAVHSLRRMSHLSPTRIGAMGSYELYDAQQKQDTLERKAMNITVSTAPGSPGSFQDYSQVVETLQHELQQSKRKESDLQHMLADMNQASTMFVDNPYLEGSPSNESVGENVKDAHIRHLQRQVTVLQASLYKSEGWSNRVSTAVKERDKALDDVSRLSSKMKEMQENNDQLMNKIGSLSSSLQEAHHNLHELTETLQNSACNGQLVAQLKDQVQRQNYEIKTLKESLNQLDLENKSLKDPVAMEGENHSLGNPTCSQEMQHLHKVVDRLKSTVLQQRSYLLQLRQPVTIGNGKSLTLSPALLINNGILNQELIARRTSSSPKLKAARINSLGSESGLGALSQQTIFGHSSQAVIGRSGTPKENLEVQHTQHHSGSDFVQDSLASGRKKLSSREILEDSFHMDVLHSPSPLPAQGGLDVETTDNQQIVSRNGYNYPVAIQGSLRHFGQQSPAAMDVWGLGLKASHGHDSGSSPQHRTLQHKPSHSEAISHRSGFEMVKPNSKSEVNGRHLRRWNLTSANNSAAMANKDASDYIDTFSQTDLNQGQKYQSPRQSTQVQQELRGFETGVITSEQPGQFVLNGNSVQKMIDNNMAQQFENSNLNSATNHSQQIYHPPLSYQQGSVRIVNHDMMGGAKVTIPAHPIHSPASEVAGTTNQEVVYVNTSVDHRLDGATITSHIDEDSSRVLLNSFDRLCPVCNNNFSHVSMENFQAHFFECFDDENPPETMKAHERTDRSCPMCNTTFGLSASQAEYEAHVHSHFNEDRPGEDFVILQP